jgi:hypothetical protein
MLVLRVVATTHVAADLADAQMHPAVAELQTFFASLGAGRNVIDLVQVRTVLRFSRAAGE